MELVLLISSLFLKRPFKPLLASFMIFLPRLLSLSLGLTLRSPSFLRKVESLLSRILDLSLLRLWPIEFGLRLFSHFVHMPVPIFMLPLLGGFLNAKHCMLTLEWHLVLKSWLRKRSRLLALLLILRNSSMLCHMLLLHAASLKLAFLPLLFMLGSNILCLSVDTFPFITLLLIDTSWLTEASLRAIPSPCLQLLLPWAYGSETLSASLLTLLLKHGSLWMTAYFLKMPKMVISRSKKNLTLPANGMRPGLLILALKLFAFALGSTLLTSVGLMGNL